ncbi:class I SAM-dependent methyltransferase [candidate division KSB1 bacterium]|nr:MAG: class I SAM-dependent methyltransferase [candidate division KSB1 bacterium]MBC6946586.1 class I SAM-dependent methyltransferase [candidate division KSB1 bacterium]MCE7940181.1 class I SAM-dependent methyltransferase [Chlorobi bacterium CHB1]MDL1873850.1 methyltransferase domain-containing protein [Cytophagia bacterium CHB2]
MMDPLYYDYYDKIYSGKNYRAEVETVLGLFQNSVGKIPKRVLDVGCGTGSHALILAEKGCDVVGIDLDCGVVDIAHRKCSGQTNATPVFLCEDVSKLEAGKFDLTVSLFNVINYIDQMDSLLMFFESIHKHLFDEGVFIFDCWNGLAAILDPPRNKDSRFLVGGEQIDITTRPCVELMNQSVRVDNCVEVTGSDGSKRKFIFSYHQTLWTPWCLKNVLMIAGFEILYVSAWMQPNVIATYNTWKITFVCQKTGKVLSHINNK